MGANNVLPVIPTFTNSAPALADLNNLSYAAQFLAVADTRPSFKFYRNSSLTLSGANAYHAIVMTNVAYDSDGTFDSTGATIVTTGWYSLWGCVQVTTIAASQPLYAALNIVAGSNNPNLASGNSKRYTGRGGGSPTSTTSCDAAICVHAVTGFALYPGDKVRLQLYNVAASMTVENNINTSYQRGRFVPSMGGTWIRSA